MMSEAVEQSLCEAKAERKRNEGEAKAKHMRCEGDAYAEQKRSKDENI